MPPAPILLNSQSPYPFNLAPPHRMPSWSGSSQRSSRSDASSTKPPDAAPRRIQVKFAPLPDPRLLDDSESSTEDDDDMKKGDMLQPVPPASTISQPTPRWSTKRLLRPLTIDGSTNLFRTASRDSVHSTQSALNPAYSPLLSRMTPLTHSISETGTRSRKEATPSPIASKKAPRSRFMLNGRVYGARRGGLTPDPFQHQRAYEQDFVEWGSGGLGSVPSTLATGAAADWDRVRGGAPYAAGAAAATPTSDRESPIINDDDDGSGMGWVIRRRQQRAEAKRKEEEANAASTAISENPPGTDGTDGSGAVERPSPKLVDIPEIVVDHHHSATSTPSASTPVNSLFTLPVLAHASEHGQAPTAHKLAPPEHMPEVAVVPPKFHGAHHHHGRPGNASRQVSHDADKAVRIASSSSNGTASSSSTATDVASSSSQGSRSDDGNDTDSTPQDEDEDDDEEDDDDELTESQKLLAECAGKEKISRHRDLKDVSPAATPGQ